MTLSTSSPLKYATDKKTLQAEVPWRTEAMLQSEEPSQSDTPSRTEATPHSDTPSQPNVAPTSAYLDYAAATPMAPEALEAMLPYFTQRFYNPSAPYTEARKVRDDLEAARAQLAHIIGARPDTITLTAGATEANNLAFAATSGHVICDAIEHESVLACAKARDHSIINVMPDGRVDPQVVRAAIKPTTELVSIALANGELGTIQPIREIARIIKEERAQRLESGNPNPIFLHTDASQAAGTVSINVSTLDADLITLSAAKVYGPKQVGVLYASDLVELKPLVLGGGQESGVRSGTQDVAGAQAFAVALQLAQDKRKQESARFAALRLRMERRLMQEFPWAQVSGPKSAKLRLPGLLHISFPGIEARRLVILLERCGVSVGTGSACAASKMRVSHVLTAIGLPEEVALGSLRITMGRPTSEAEVDYACECLSKAVHAELARLGKEKG